LKTARTLLTDEQVARARQLCETIEEAAAQRKKVVRKSDYWVKMSDEQLRERLPDSRVPRAFNVSTEGCPQHGKAVYKSGTYPWKLDRDQPFTIICPVGGERYPSNDFDAYYRSGMKDKSLLTGPHADPGRGWVAPNGEKYWLVGYACHWNWQQTWLPAVNNLSRAYLLTGDRKYARKAIVMLDRIAEIYPGMDYSKQSRYAERMSGGYHGKIVNAIWETMVYRGLAIAYDYVFDTLVGDDAIDLPWRTAAEIRTNIEANLLEEGFDGIERRQIAGNFGMHQSAQAYAAVVRQHGPMKELLDSIFTNTGGSYRREGLNYALYNLVFKDGMPYETSPGYCFSWVGNFVLMSEALFLAKMNLYEHPKFKLMFDAPLQMICAGGFTPSIGDSGSIRAGWAGPNARAYEAAYRHLEQPMYAWALNHLGGLRTDKIDSFEDLFTESIVGKAEAAAKTYKHRPPSRVLDGYGLAVLNNPKDSVAVSMYYGIRGGHGHFDRLNIELFAHGRRLAPDLGYPDFMNAFVPGIYSWSKNTISHNTLAVDEKIQKGNRGGTVLRFHDSPTVHVVDVDAPGSYEQATIYRRTLVLVDVGEDDSYVVDVFRVRGGQGHVLSVHGQDGAFELHGAALPPPIKEGTLAGPEVPYGHLYDAPKLSEPGYSGSYSRYNGSGYQHFFNWQRVTPDAVVTGRWQVAGEPAATLRVHVPPNPGQELIVADAYVSPTRKVPTALKYMLLKRPADTDGNTFVTVWEPSAGKPLIDRVELHDDASLGTGHDRTVALTIRRGDTVDRVIVAPKPGERITAAPDLTTDAAVTVVSTRGSQQTRTFAAGGSKLTGGEGTDAIEVPTTISGTIRTADYGARSIAVETTSPTSDPNALRGRTVRIFNDRHSCVYRIATAESRGSTLTLKLTGSDVFTGRFKIASADEKARTISTKTKVLYPFNAAGMTLVSDDLKHTVGIVSMDKGTVQLAEGANAKAFAASVGKDAWIADFGPGDRIEIERFVHDGGF